MCHQPTLGGNEIWEHRMTFGTTQQVTSTILINMAHQFSTTQNKNENENDDVYFDINMSSS